MADANAGTLSVAITGDISDLLSALREAQSVAVQAGQAISAALSSGAEGVKDLDNSVSAAVQTLDSLVREAQATQDAFQQAASVYNDAVNAFNSGAIDAQTFGMALEQLKDSARDAGVELEGVSDKTKQATSSFDELLKKIQEFTGIAIGVETLRELGQAIVEASSRAEDLSISLERIAGSSAAAGEQVEKLEQLSTALGVPFAEVSSAAQRMTSDLQDFGAAEELITLAANAAAASGRNFDSLAQVLDKVAESGMLSARMMVQLGISADSMAEALGTSANDVKTLKEAFESLSTGGRIEALAQAMGDLDGMSAKHAAAMSGQWTQFANIFESKLKEIGDAIAPFLKILLELSTTVVKVYSDLATGLVDVFKATTEGLTNPKQAVADLQAAFAAFKNIGEDVATTFQTKTAPALDKLGDSIFRTGQISQEAKEKIKDIADELNADGDALVGIEDKIGPAMKKFQDAINEGVDPSKVQSGLVSIENQLDEFISRVQNSAAGATVAGQNLIAAAQAQRDAIKLIVENADIQALPVVTAKITGAMDAQLEAFNEFGVKLPPIAATISAGMMDIMMEQTAYQKSLDDLPLDMGASRWEALLNPIGQLNADFKALGMTIGEDVTAKLAAFGEAFVRQMEAGNLSVSQLQEGFNRLLAEVTKFPDLADSWIPKLQEAVDEMERMHGVSLQVLNDETQLAQAAMNAAISQGKSADAVLILAENLNTAQIRANQFKEASAGLATLYQGVTKEFSAAWTAFGTGIGDAIVGAESFKQAFTNAVDALEKKLAELVTNYLLGMLKNAILQNTSLVDDFNKLFNSVFGIGGDVAKGLSGTQSAIQQTGQAMTSMLDDEGNVIKGTMDKVTQGVDQVGQAASQALSSIFNIVTGALTAIASIIQAFELAHMEKQLATIEGETRRTANALENGVVNQLLDADQHLANIDGVLNGALIQFLGMMTSDLDSIAADIHALLGIAETSGLGGSGSGGGGGTAQALADLNNQLNAANTIIQNLRDELAQLGATTQSDNVSVAASIPMTTAYTAATTAATAATSTVATAMSSLATTVQFTQNSVANMGDVFVSAANIIQQIVAPGSVGKTDMGGAFSSTPPNYTYNPGSLWHSPDMFSGNQPGSAPWTPGGGGGGNLTIYVTTPSNQTIAQGIVSALRNNANLKV